MSFLSFLLQNLAGASVGTILSLFLKVFYIVFLDQVLQSGVSAEFPQKTECYTELPQNWLFFLPFIFNSVQNCQIFAAKFTEDRLNGRSCGRG